MDVQKMLGLTIETLVKHHGHNDTTGDLPIPEPDHRSGLTTISSAGERTLWIVCAIMFAATLIFGGWSARQPRKTRLFPGQLTTLITCFAAISYFAMATHTGRSIVRAPGHNAYREVFWARYADWLVTTPLLLTDCALFAGIPLIDMIFVIVADVGMILTGLFGALDPHYRTKWGFFTFSCLFFLYVLWALLFTGTKTAYARSDKLGNAYLVIGVYTVIAWIAYPIVFAFGEGTNVISADTEVLLYGILDVIAKPGFGLILLGLHTALPDSHVSLSSAWTDPRGASRQGYGSIPQDSA